MKLQERLREHDMINGRYGVTASVADEAAAQLDLYEAALREIIKIESGDGDALQALTTIHDTAFDALNSTDTGA